MIYSNFFFQDRFILDLAKEFSKSNIPQFSLELFQIYPQHKYLISKSFDFTSWYTKRLTLRSEIYGGLQLAGEGDLQHIPKYTLLNINKRRRSAISAGVCKPYDSLETEWLKTSFNGQFSVEL